MNLVDVVIILILLVFAFEGLKEKFFSQLLDLGAFLTAFLVSLIYYNYPAKILQDQFQLSHSLSNVLSFILLWYLSEFSLAILFKLTLKKAVNQSRRLWLDAFSFVPALFKGLVIVATLLILTATFPVQPKVKQQISSSAVAGIILEKSYRLEAPLKNVFGGLAQDTLSFLTVKPQTDESVNLGFQTSNFVFDEKLEAAMIEKVNQERVKTGLQTLKYDPNLTEVARGHSADMFKRGYFSHYSPERYDIAKRASAVGVKYLVLGENLAYAPSLELAHNGLMQSSGHRANILSVDYSKIGIGAAKTTDLGIMFTQVFSN